MQELEGQIDKLNIAKASLKDDIRQLDKEILALKDDVKRLKSDVSELRISNTVKEKDLLAANDIIK